VTPIRNHAPDVPEHVETLCLRLMARKPEDRPATMSEVVSLVEQAGVSESGVRIPPASARVAAPATARPASTNPAPAGTPTVALSTSAAPAARPRVVVASGGPPSASRGQLWVPALVLIAGVVVLGGALHAANKAHHAPKPAVETPPPAVHEEFHPTGVVPGKDAPKETPPHPKPSSPPGPQPAPAPPPRSPPSPPPRTDNAARIAELQQKVDNLNKQILEAETHLASERRPLMRAKIRAHLDDLSKRRDDLVLEIQGLGG
jgi:hypothetical protein